ncbi:MAG TPA: sugar ABC transporter substrate-binding protein [Gemmataceae bacterium]|jgi:multiple sugar transport system substrate-binding protein|nr:sugar ABC transporter substrate-binding protein [Gemmataceae bacterium]
MKLRLSSLIGILATVCAVGGVCPLATNGCRKAQSNAPTPGESKKFAGKQLNIILANHPWSEALAPMLEDFKKTTGMELTISHYPEDQLSQKLQIGLTAGSNRADVFMLRPLQEARQFAENHWLADLLPHAQSDKDWNWSDFQEAARDTVTFDKAVYGVPVVTEREMVYYRKDLFDKAGLKPPATLDELKAAAAKLNDPANGVAGIVMRGQRAPSVTQFSSFLYSFGGDWMKDGRSVLDSPEALTAYKFYGGLLKNYGPQGALNMSWPQGLAVFQQGKAAIWIDADVFYPSVIDPAKSTVTASVGFAPFPQGPAGAKNYNVTSWALGINESSPEKAGAAWEFVQWATSAPVVMALQQKGVPGARLSVWSSPDGLKGFPEACAKVIQIQVNRGIGHDRPRVIKVGAARDIVGDPVVTAIQGGNVEASVKKAHEQFNAFLQQDK